MRWRVEMLGGLRAICGDRVIDRFRTRQTGLLLAYLAYNPDRAHLRETLVELLWPGVEPASGRNRLSKALSWLRDVLEPPGTAAGAVLIADRFSLRIDPGTLVADVELLRGHLRSARRAADPTAKARFLASAVAAYSGELLPGYHEPWVLEQRAWLAERYARALEALVAHCESAGEPEQALEYARRGVLADPLREESHRDLIRLLAAAGRPDEALRHAAELERLLKQELGDAPTAATQALVREIERAIVDRRPATDHRPPMDEAGSSEVEVPATFRPAPIGRQPASPIDPEPTVVGPRSQRPGGQMRLVTLLFADVSDARSAHDETDPEASAERLQRFLEAASDFVRRYDGCLEPLVGSRLLALYGVPEAHEDDAERAIRTALELRDVVREFELGIRVALETGRVYVGDVGPESGSKTTVVGPSVNRAMALLEQAVPGQILIGEATYRRAGWAFRSAPLALRIEGVPQPVTAYAAEALLPHAPRARGIEGRVAPLIGRDVPFAALRSAAIAVQGGQGQIVTLSGEAGVGKSRLVSELKLAALGSELWALGEEVPPFSAQSPAPRAAAKLLFLEGRCLAFHQGVGYAVFVDMLRDHLSGTDLPACLRDLAARGDLTPEGVEEIGPLLGNLLSLRFGTDWDERLKNADPEQIRHRTLLAIRDFFLARSRQQPLVLVFEDLHWVDRLSLDALSLLVEAVPRAPILLLCVYRPQEAHACRRLERIAAQRCPDRYTELRLHELTPEQSHHLLQALLDSEAVLPPIGNLVQEKSRGNPFFIEEVVRALIESGTVHRENREWQLREGAVSFSVPDSVQGVIQSRVDRLAPELRQVLESAAVIGRLFRPRLLERLVQALDATSAAPSLEPLLWQLEDQGLIYPERVVPEEEYSFKHVLTQETIYQNLVRRQRASLHQQVAEAIEALYAPDLEAHYEPLAHHYDRSEAVEKAIEYLLKAGEKSRRAYLNEEAVAYFQRGLERLDDVGDRRPGSAGVTKDQRPRTNDQGPGAESQELRAKRPEPERSDPHRLAALKGLGQTYHGMGKVAEAEQYFRRAIEVGREMGSAAREQARLYYWLGYMLFWQSRFQELIRVGEEGLALLGDDIESVEAALMNALIAIGSGWVGDIRRYREFNLRNERFLLHLPYSEELRWVYANVAEVYAGEKHAEKSMEWLLALERMAHQHHDMRSLGEVHFRVASNILEPRGDLRGAVSRYEEAVALLEKIGDEKLASRCLIFMGMPLISLGEIQQAEERTRRALVTMQSVGSKAEIARSHLRIGIVSRCQGSCERAAEAFQKGVQICRELGSPLEVRLTLCLGWLYLAQEKRREALCQFQAVIRLGGLGTDHLAAALAGIDEAYQSPEEFREFCRRLGDERPEFSALPFVQWFLEPAQLALFSQLCIHDRFQTSLSSAWVWTDPLEDCSLTVQNGFRIAAANGRDLWGVNQSAPRLLRPVSGEFAAQTVCAPLSASGTSTPTSPCAPAIGGLLLWKDEKNFVRLDHGAGGSREISFRSCLGDEHRLHGRGRLPCERVILRLERREGWVDALCSADGQSWFTLGQASLSVEDPLQVGLFAIGSMDRALYPSAYPDGTAIRFESFTLWRQALALAPSS